MRTGFEFADVYDEVIARAGGEQSTAEDVVRVRRGVRLVLERWEKRGYNTWRVRRLDACTSHGDPFITLPDCVDDIMEVKGPNGSSLQRMPAAKYMQISRKDQQGVPSAYWLSRQECPKLYLHPAGGGYDIEVWYVERPADFDRLAHGLEDVPGRWLEALILGLAHDMACKRPSQITTPNGASMVRYDEQLIARLKADAAEAEELAARSDRDRARFRYRPTGMRR